MATIEQPFFPIIHVRGYAMTEREIVDTVSTPYMGFDPGATKVRQAWDGKVQRLIFESPLVRRLMKDYGYRDIYEDGSESGIGCRRRVSLYTATTSRPTLTSAVGKCPRSRKLPRASTI